MSLRDKFIEILGSNGVSLDADQVDELVIQAVLEASRQDQPLIKERDALRARLEAAELSACRPEVRAFAELMETKLRENDHKGGWEHCTEGFLLKRLKAETAELEKVCDQFGHIPKSRRLEVGREAADVANFAMMLADLYKALPSLKPVQEREG